jgi:hypothetical protein
MSGILRPIIPYPTGRFSRGTLYRHFVPGYDQHVPPGQKPSAHRSASHYPSADGVSTLGFIHKSEERRILAKHRLVVRRTQAGSLCSIGLPDCRANSQSHPGSYRREPAVTAPRRQSSIGFQPVICSCRRTTPAMCIKLRVEILALS